jgi:outer membrane protein TolC
MLFCTHFITIGNSRRPRSTRIPTLKFSRPPVLLFAALLLLATPAAQAQTAALPPASAGTGGLPLLEAVRMALTRDPNISIEQARLRSSEGALLSASGRFDPELTTRLTQTAADDPLTELASRESRTLENVFGLTQEFRTGFSIAPALTLRRSDDVTAGTGAVNLGTLAFNLRQPLLRGRGRAVVAAGERSAERGVAASRLDLRHTTALRVLDVVTRYWTLAAAARNLAILRQSEASSRLLLDNTRKLIAADVTPAAELVQVEANLAAKQSAGEGGERALFQSRQDLGREIGLTPAEIAALPLPSDPLPRLAAVAVPPPEAADRFVQGALARRADLAAARERLAGGEILATAAGDAVRPQLDLVLAPSYTGFVAGDDAGSFFSPLYSNVPGASVAVGFNLSWPTANRRARGDLAQARALREEGELAVDLVAKQIGADVPAALEAVASSARQLAKAEEAVGLFERAVDNEEKKLAAGTSTLLDVISQRDRLTAAQQGQVSAHLALALALVRLRFETGTLLAGESGEVGGSGSGGHGGHGGHGGNIAAEAVGFAELTTVPFAGPAGGGGAP